MTIGLMRLREVPGREDAQPAGTGTLVSVGEVHGVLTAAHVLQELPDTGKIGYVRFLNRPDQFQTGRIDMRFAAKLIVGTPPFDDSVGPDIGFLRLPMETVGGLKATNVFFNLEKAATASDVDAPRVDFHAMVGVLAERTSELPSHHPETLRIGVEGLFGLGNIVKEYPADDFDRFEFVVGFDPGYDPPRSYGGTSGGGVWKFSLDYPECASILARRLVGVAFWESLPNDDGTRTLTCHGPRTIYGPILDRIRSAWPS